jgi:hypothetical protein
MPPPPVRAQRWVTHAGPIGRPPPKEQRSAGVAALPVFEAPKTHECLRAVGPEALAQDIGMVSC